MKLSRPHKILYVVLALIMLDYDAYMVVNLADLCRDIHCIAYEKAGIESWMNATPRSSRSPAYSRAEMS